jgi:hypothetical protein
MGKTREVDEVSVYELTDGEVLQDMRLTDNRLGDSSNLYGVRKSSTTEAFGSNLSDLGFSLKSPERSARFQMVEIHLEWCVESFAGI